MISGMILYGLINSSMFVLMTIGFSLSFGISGIANFAYGAFYVGGAYVCWQMLYSIGLSYPLSAAIAVVITGFLGAIFYRFVLFRVRGHALSEVILTFSLGIGMLETFRSMGLTGHRFRLPKFTDGSLEILSIYLDYQRVIILGLAPILLLSMWFFTKRTKLGLAFKGIAQDEQTALCFGIDSETTAMMSMGIGSALAAFAAIVIVPLSLIQVEEGTHILILVLAVGIVGGIESTLGIILASLIFGFSQIIVATYFSPHYTVIVMLAAIVLILAIKPSGLLGKFKELEERV